MRYILCLSLPVLVVLPLASQETAGQNYALLIGVRKYDKNELKDLLYTENDVTQLAKVLSDAGYKRVLLMTQKEGAEEPRYLPMAENIRRELKGLLALRKPGDTVLVAFAGHGVQFKGEDEPYFCPMDAKLSQDGKLPAGKRATLVSLSEVYRELGESKASVKLLLVDACRNDPQSAGARARAEVDLESVTRPQVKQPPKGVAAFFSCSRGEKAYESDTLKHGVFFYHVLEGFRGKAADAKGLVTVQKLVGYVTSHVSDKVQELFSADTFQQPAFNGSLEGPLPIGRIDPALLQPVISNSIGMKLVYIAPGKFIMGSPVGEAGRDDSDEGPTHEDEISRGFYMGKHEVTRGQFRRFVDDTGYETEPERDGEGGRGWNARGFTDKETQYTWQYTGFGQTDSHPVVNVTWNDARKFCAWLSKKEGKTYRLPTEAEWEYACRAGTKTRFHGGDSDNCLQRVGNIADRSLKARWNYSNVADATFKKLWTAWFEKVSWDDGYAFTAPVGQYEANAWGLHDMHGNVWEWCQDWYDKDYYKESLKRDPQGPAEGEKRVFRGGSFLPPARFCRSALRDSNWPGFRGYHSGFRVVAVLSPRTP